MNKNKHDIFFYSKNFHFSVIPIQVGSSVSAFKNTDEFIKIQYFGFYEKQKKSVRDLRTKMFETLWFIPIKC